MVTVAQLCDARGSAREAGVVGGCQECAAFARWLDGLPAEGYAALKQLRESGCVSDLAALETQLRQALVAGGGVGPGVAPVGRRLLAILARRGDATCLLVGAAARPLPAGP